MSKDDFVKRVCKGRSTGEGCDGRSTVKWINRTDGCWRVGRLGMECASWESLKDKHVKLMDPTVGNMVEVIDLLVGADQYKKLVTGLLRDLTPASSRLELV